MTMLIVKELPKLGTGMHADAHGLYLNVKPTGARSWIFRATINGRRREIGLGGFPVVNLQEARDAAIDMQRQLRAGVDPLAELTLPDPRQNRRPSSPFATPVEGDTHSGGAF